MVLAAHRLAGLGLSHSQEDVAIYFICTSNIQQLSGRWHQGMYTCRNETSVIAKLHTPLTCLLVTGAYIRDVAWEHATATTSAATKHVSQQQQ